MATLTDPSLFPLVREPASRWERSGLSPEQERWFDWGLKALTVLFVAGWLYTVVGWLADPEAASVAATRLPILGPRSPFAITGNPNAPPSIAGRLTSSPLGAGAAPLAPVITGELLARAAASYAESLPREVRGHSGALYVNIVHPDENPDLPAPTQGALSFGTGADLASEIPGPGIWNVVLREGGITRGIPNFAVVRTVPISRKVGGRIGRYRIGSWPCETGDCPSNPIYATPKGLIEVTPQNKEMFLSKHIQLKQFITKLQDDVWPKYVVADPQVLDKIELVVQELEAMGYPVTNLFAVSGFRSPWYNASGGTTAGRGRLSRHMYGDAMDIAVDNDRNGLMDDLNKDGKINLADARIIGKAVDRVEAKYPDLVGGMHYYPPTGGHRGMVHIDTRGNLARW